MVVRHFISSFACFKFNLDEKIQMVDLKGQYENIKETVNNSIQEVLDTNTYINGPEVHKFQKILKNIWEQNT